MNLISIIKNIFTAVCLAVSLVLVLQLLFVFVEEKPTSTSYLDEELEITDLPEVVVCMNPGFNKTTSLKYGYNNNYYYYYYWAGYSRAKQFVRWNGYKYYNKSSREILEEALLLHQSQGLVSRCQYFEKMEDLKDARSHCNVTLRMLTYPFGITLKWPTSELATSSQF